MALVIRSRRLLSRALRERDGQALTEFAIVAPLIVMILLFAIWFYELVHIKLKVQEAARFAAWEATAMPLHDYQRGPSAQWQLSGQMSMRVMAETAMRYADLDSSTVVPRRTGIFAASWMPPLTVVYDGAEEGIPGGGIVNFLFSFAGTIIDFFSALSYTNANPVAKALIGSSKANKFAGARKDRLFGSSEWGFNRLGYVNARTAIMVQNQWFQRGVGGLILSGSGGMILPNQGVFMTEHNAVLADSWKLNNGQDNYGGLSRPGFSEGKAYWEQVNRMYFVNRRTRGLAKQIITRYKQIMDKVLGITFNQQTSPLNTDDVVKPALTSINYRSRNEHTGQGDPETGRARISQDRPQRIARYDTAPVGLTGDAGEALRPYGETLQERGNWFMGCQRDMSLGCPSATLQQDNPFGDYIIRDEGGGH